MAINGRIENGIRVELDVTPGSWNWAQLSHAQFAAAVTAILGVGRYVTEVRANFGDVRVVVVVPRDDMPTTTKMHEMRDAMVAAATQAVGALPSRYQTPR